MTATLALDTSASATAANVGALRREVRRWLNVVLGDDPDAVDDLASAASEALENAADHAFVGADAVGTMCLRAVDRGDRVTIVVSDDGRWLAPDAATGGYRGRGTQMMQTLVDTARVRPSTGGTSVLLVRRRSPAPDRDG